MEKGIDYAFDKRMSCAQLYCQMSDFLRKLQNGIEWVYKSYERPDKYSKRQPKDLINPKFFDDALEAEDMLLWILKEYGESFLNCGKGNYIKLEMLIWCLNKHLKMYSREKDELLSQPSLFPEENEKKEKSEEELNLKIRRIEDFKSLLKEGFCRYDKIYL